MMSQAECRECEQIIEYSATPSWSYGGRPEVVIEDVKRSCTPDCKLSDEAVIEMLEERASEYDGPDRDED